MKTLIFASIILFIYSFGWIVHSSYTTCSSTTTHAPSCIQPICKACPPSPNYILENLTIDEVAAGSPLYAILLKDTPVAKQCDSQCFTFVPLSEGTYLFFYTSTNSDNTSFTQLFFARNALNGPGNIEFVGISGFTPDVPIIDYGYLVGITCEGYSAIYNAINHIAAQGCNPIPGIFDPALSYSRNPHPEPSCIAQAQKSLETYVEPGTMIPVPRKLPIQCVASYAGISVMNSEILYNTPGVQPITLP